MKLASGNGLPLLRDLPEQLVKACLLELVDYCLRFGLPGLPTGRVFLRPTTDQPPAHEVANIFCQTLATNFTCKALCSQAYRDDIFDFGPAQAGDDDIIPDRLLFASNLEGAPPEVPGESLPEASFAQQRPRHDAGGVVARSNRAAAERKPACKPGGVSYPLAAIHLVSGRSSQTRRPIRTASG